RCRPRPAARPRADRRATGADVRRVLPQVRLQPRRAAPEFETLPAATAPRTDVAVRSGLTWHAAQDSAFDAAAASFRTVFQLRPVRRAPRVRSASAVVRRERPMPSG